MLAGDLVKFVYGWIIRWSMHLLYALLQNPLGCIGVVFYGRILIVTDIKNRQNFCITN